MFDYDLPISYQFGWALLIVTTFLLLVGVDYQVRHLVFIGWCMSIGLILYGYSQKD